MFSQLGVYNTLLAALAVGMVVATNTGETCRFIPGDAGWPTQNDWITLNDTVGGRLIATTPRARVCHAPEVDESACNALRTPLDFAGGSPPSYATRLGLNMTQWDNSTNYILVPAEMQSAYYQNQSCDPFTPTTQPCVLGNTAVYSINVQGASDVLAGMQFAHAKNVRLTIKNTGHDYLGKSSGLGSLSLWTHNLKTLQIIPQYTSPAYSGAALKLGAGVNGGEALEHVSQAGYRIVTGECGTVGIAGGYSQGGGHSPLNGAYGLGSDNVLEWEVVTGKGEHIIATPQNNHSDIYWALSGGGGGTYGVVLSMTAKIHPDGPVAGPQLAFAIADGVTNETYWAAVAIFFKNLPGIIKGNNNSVQFTLWNDNLGALFTLPDQGTVEANATLAPLLAELNGIGMPYTFGIAQLASYADYYASLYGPLPYGEEPPSTSLNSRLVPEWVVTDPDANAKLIDAMKLTTQVGDFKIDCSAADVNKTFHADNSVLPAWRESIVGCNALAFWNWTAPLSQNYAVKARMTDTYAPAWDAATPGSGIYMNEVDSWYKGDFKQNFFGANYPRLLAIKHTNDPNRLFYGNKAVGSDEFTIDESGRLCDL